MKWCEKASLAAAVCICIFSINIQLGMGNHFFLLDESFSEDNDKVEKNLKVFDLIDLH